MIRYREGVDVLELLGRCGYSTYALRKQRIFGEATIQKFRRGGLPSWKELDFICGVTAYDVGELIEYCQDCEEGEVWQHL